MKRLTFVLVSAALLALGASMPAAADHGGVDAEPACADIVGSSGTYDATTSLVAVRFDLGGPSCRSVRYVAFIYDELGGTELDRMVVHGTKTTDPFVEFGTIEEPPGGDPVVTEGLDASANTDNDVYLCGLTIYRGKVVDTGGFDATGACTAGQELLKGGVTGGGGGIN
jgi:hypothetical protein